MDEIFIIGRDADRVSSDARLDKARSFSSLREFDLWRYGPRSTSEQTIEVDVTAALRELGVPRSDLTAEIREVIEALCTLEEVPKVKGILPCGISERSFYRRWDEQIPEVPLEFLARVRLLHGRRLVEQYGLPPKTAADRAGYRSTWHFRRALVQRAERNGGLSGDE